jgi:carbon storage regulator CsrA
VPACEAGDASRDCPSSSGWIDRGRRVNREWWFCFTEDAMGNLVLTRGVGESIEIKAGDQVIRLQVAKVQGGNVQLAFAAPQSVRILRGELAERNREAA